ncbi:class I SAM-dependent methyltransferase [Candidatus Thioglobus sp.]|nr:class I SAM-dependent methyltransferase [Candidatus Thioglobus sp.]MDC1026439.1 class I SAM-dependent methyltransferase [Candidatus Thioglobus sp.]
MTEKKGLKDAYLLKTPEDSINLYKTWASTYDDDFAKQNDYRSPIEIAKYFAKYSNNEDNPILDVGAGTGLIGECLNLNSKEVDAIDISPEMLNIARAKNCYSKIIEADLTKRLLINDNHYGAIISAGTFTHGHVGPNVLDELLRVTRSGGLFVFTIHYKLFKKAGFDKKFIEIKKNITKPIFHKVDVYGNNPDKDHGSDQVIITVFRKK